MARRGLGYRPDPWDARDRSLSAHLAAFGAADYVPPSSASVEHEGVGPKDQDQTSSCTGQATAQAVRLAYLRQGVACPELSALFAYYIARAQSGDQGVDEGSYLRSAIKGVQQLGIPEEQAWPFSNDLVNRHPGLGAYRAAYDRRGIRAYHRIDPGDTNGVRRAIAAGYPVVGGWQVSEAFLDWDGSAPITAQVDTIGGHALPVVSYAGDGTFRLLNSWGAGWGRDGFAVVDDAFIAQGTDLWAVQVL